MALGRRRRLDRSVREKGVAPEPQPRVREQEKTVGPFDVEDAPDDAVARIDLGALRMPAVPGGDLQLEANQAGQIMSATLRLHGSSMQVVAFAAPRHGGLWAEVRGDIVSSLTAQGGSAKESDGAFGTELVARVAMKGTLTPARFIGVDGSRWFLRAFVTGPAATDPAAAGELEEALRNVVVVRGAQPMPVGDQIPLRVPRAVEAPAAGDDQDESQP